MKFIKFNFRELFKQSVIEDVFTIRGRRLLTYKIYELNEETDQNQWFVIELVYERKGIVFPVMLTFFKYAGSTKVRIKQQEFMSFNNKPFPKSTEIKLKTMLRLVGLIPC